MNRLPDKGKFLTYGVLGVAGAGKSLDNTVVRVGARELSGRARKMGDGMASVAATVSEREGEGD